jgi:hypothetical protein
MNKMRIRETVTADQVNSKSPGLDSKLVDLAKKTCEQYKNTLDKKAYTHLYMNVLNKLRSRAIGEITSEAEAQSITKKYADALSTEPQSQDHQDQSQEQTDQSQDQAENNTEENKEEGGEENNGNFTRAGISSEEATSIQRKLINDVFTKNAKLFSNEIKNIEGYRDGDWSVNFGLANLNSKTQESLNSKSLESFKEDKKSKDYVSTEIAFNIFLDKKTAKNSKAAANDKSSEQSKEESDEGKPEEADQENTQTETARNSTAAEASTETSEKKEEALFRAEAFLRRFEEAEENTEEGDRPTTETMKNVLEKIREIIIDSLNKKGGEKGLKISTERDAYWIIFDKGKYLSAISPTEGYFSLLLRAQTKAKAQNGEESGLKTFGKGLLNWMANA